MALIAQSLFEYGGLTAAIDGARRGFSDLLYALSHGSVQAWAFVGAVALVFALLAFLRPR